MTTRDMVLVALFAAIVAVLALAPPIQLAAGVPITAQTLGVMLAGSLLGAKRGALALLVFIILVAAGLPLLPGGRGGLGVFQGATGGFLLSWPIAAGIIGWLTERFWTRLNWLQSFAFNIAGGILVVYLLGVPWMAMVAELSATAALVSAGAFIPGDLLKAGLAAFVAVSIKRSYPLIAAPAQAGSPTI